MKEIICYYYNIDIYEIEEYNTYVTFKYNGELYYFVYYNRTKEELNDILKVVGELKQKGILVHDIIYNKDGLVITNVREKPYILLKINSNITEVINFTDICENTSNLRLNNNSSRLYRNNWEELWSEKIDYFEYQVGELGHNKDIILNSFNYYIGLAENAISYVNYTKNNYQLSDYDHITLSHRRIFFPNIHLNYYNPLSFIFDLEVRDIAEALKVNFFNNENVYLDLQTYLKIHPLTPFSYHMLYARLIYPSYYFDIYEDVMNNMGSEEQLLKIVEKVNSYEEFLEFAYLEISKYTKLHKIDWLIKKEL